MIEFSFDDGYPSDLRVVELLKKYGFTGTFYLTSTECNGREILSLKDVKERIVGQGMEVGGHSVSHAMDMKLLDDKKLKFEIENNKLMLEKLLGISLTKFCYPRGRHDERVRAAVKAAGYKEARTTEVLEYTNKSGDPFQTPTTIHLFQRNEYDGLDWLRVAKGMFVEYLRMKAEGRDVFYSCWGHSYELLKYNDFDRFEDLLKFMRDKISPTGIATNGAVGL